MDGRISDGEILPDVQPELSDGREKQDLEDSPQRKEEQGVGLSIPDWLDSSLREGCGPVLIEFQEEKDYEAAKSILRNRKDTRVQIKLNKSLTTNFLRVKRR